MTRSFATRLAVLALASAALTFSVAAQKRNATDTLAPEAIGIDIEQCANGPLAAPINCNVSSGNQGYVRGAVNESKSHYYEGDFVPIRFIASGLTVGRIYSVTLGYDYTKGGKYANDYLGDYDATESVMNNPCVNVTGCTLTPVTTFLVPIDPEVTNGFNRAPGDGDDIVQLPGDFSCFGCTITSAGTPGSEYTRSGVQTGDSTKNFTLTFTADKTTVVIAYGSHISTRPDWGLANSAVNITGSPYHNYVVDFPGANGGSRDLQLSASAVIFPARLTVVKTVATMPAGSTSTFAFAFTSSANFGTTAFSLVDNVEGSGGGSRVSPNIISFGSGNVITVTEENYAPTWTLAGLSCVNDVGGLPHAGSVVNLGTRSTAVTLAEGQFVTCTFSNTQFAPTAAPASVSGRVIDSFGNGIGGVRLSITDAQTSDTWTTISSPFGYYTIEGPEAGNFYVMTVSSKRYSFADDTRTFTLNEDLVGFDWVANP